MGERFSENPPDFVDLVASLPPLVRDEPDKHEPAKLKQTDMAKAAGDGGLSSMLARNGMRPVSPKLAAFISYLIGDHDDVSRVYGCTGGLVDHGLALVKDAQDRAFILALNLDGKWHGVGVVALCDPTVIAVKAAMVDIGASPETRARDAKIAKAQEGQRKLDGQKIENERVRREARKSSYAKAMQDKDAARVAQMLGSTGRQ